MGGSPNPRHKVKFRDTDNPCRFIARNTGQKCGTPALPGALMCQVHLKTFIAHGEQKFVKCKDCFLVTPHIGESGIITDEVIEAVKGDCDKAFWVSHGREPLLRKDLCYWDTAALLQPVETPEDALNELKGVIEDLKLRRSQMERVLAKEGGVMTPMYLQLTDRLTDLLKDYVELKRGKQTFGRPGSLDSLADSAEKTAFLKRLVDSKDGYEDGIRIEETRTLQVKKDPRVIRLEAGEAKAKPATGSASALERSEASSPEAAGEGGPQYTRESVGVGLGAQKKSKQEQTRAEDKANPESRESPQDPEDPDDG